MCTSVKFNAIVKISDRKLIHFQKSYCLVEVFQHKKFTKVMCFFLIQRFTRSKPIWVKRKDYRSGKKRKKGNERPKRIDNAAMTRSI